MIRKLAITVFAMSLTLVGCGSSSTSKKDAAPDTSADVAGNKDVLPTPDTTVATSETGAAEVKTPDTAVDTSVSAEVGPKLDVASSDTTPADTRDSGAADRTPDTTFVKLDTGTVDTKDAPAVDTAVISDASSEVGGDAQAD